MLTKLCLGTWSLGGSHFGPYDSSNVGTCLNEAYDLGIRTLDTALFYAKGQSVSFIKQHLGSKREHLFISSKGGLVWEGNAVRHDASPDALVNDCESTLRALNTEYLDLYSLHWPDSITPIQDSVEALIKLKERSLIKEWGVCNLSQEERDLVWDIYPFDHFQSPYNWLRRHDTSVLDDQQKRRFNWWVYSPLEQGVLATSAYRSSVDISKKDFRRQNPYYMSPDAIDLDTFHQFARESGCTSTQFALKWLDTQDAVDKIIWGPRTVSQLMDGVTIF